MSLNYVPRVTQLDAVQLDNQLEDLLRQYVFQASDFIQPGILQPILPELDLLIRTWIFKYSVYSKKSTFGQQMLSLYYRPDNITKSKLYWYYGYTVGLKYFKDRMTYSFTSNTKIQDFVHRLENIQIIGDVMNFLRFIHNGRHPRLVDFILGLQLSADKLTREDLTDFSWTRELLWHNLIELIGVSMSLVSLFGLKRRFYNVTKFLWSKKQISRHSDGKVATMTLNTLCSYCGHTPTLPHTMGCSHIFCFYCLSASKNADENFACPECYHNGKEVVRFEMVAV